MFEQKQLDVCVSVHFKEKMKAEILESIFYLICFFFFK